MVKYTRLSTRKSVSSNSCLLSCVGSSSVAHSFSSKMLWHRGELSSRGQFTNLSLTMTLPSGVVSVLDHPLQPSHSR